MNGIHAKHYTLQINPDLSKFSFSAEIIAELEASVAVSKVIFNVKDLAVWNCWLLKHDEFKACIFATDPGKEILSVEFDEPISGEIIVKIDYEGKINDQMAGFYRSRYVENGQEKYIAVTQFQESDARRAMPCMDNPLQKATFDIEMVVEKHQKAVSNEIFIEEKVAGGNKKRVKFRRTPKMSTYLLFIGIGEFDCLRNEKDPRISVLTIPGRTQYAQYGAVFGQQALDYCERYFQIPYPLPKLDLIGVPDFAFGAMENWGAITFRENLLLFYPEITSKSGEQRICEVIAHEIVHQWFGNLVTPSDWKYLWLNESFATYFAYHAVDHYYPRWDIWGQFLIGQTDTALSRDQLKDTVSIEIPGEEHLAINSSTAPIIYSKGGSILRQVEGYIGEKAFQKGLKCYLTGHAYGNASSRDFWKAFEDVSEKPVTAMMKSWVEQPGYPLVEVERDQNELLLTQGRFTCIAGSFNQIWHIPVSVRVFDKEGSSVRMDILMDEKSVRLDLGKNVVAYKVNDNQTGFYRVKYRNQDDLGMLKELVSQKQISSKDRYGIQNDLFALVKAHETSIFEYLAFLDCFVQESAFLPLTSIAGNLWEFFIVLDASKRQAVQDVGIRFFENVLGRMGLDPSPDEPVTTSILRDQVLWHTFIYGAKEVEAFGTNRFLQLMHGENIHPDIMKAVLQIGARTLDAEALDWMKNRFRVSDSEHERMNILAGMACVKKPELIYNVLDFAMTEVPGRNRFMPIAALGTNTYAESLLWEWFIENLPGLEKMHPLHFERVITGIVPVAGIEKAPEVRDFLTGYMNKTARAKDAIGLALEKLEINVRMRKE